MKNTILTLTYFTINVLTLVAQPSVKKMEEILDCTDGFRLEEEFAFEGKKGLNPFINHLYEVRISEMFNRETKALVHLDSLVEKYYTSLGSWQTARLIQKKAMILFEGGLYGKAADYINDHLKYVTDRNDSTELIKAFCKYNEVRNVPCPVISRPNKKVTVNYEISPNPKGFHYAIPVVVHGKTYLFIHDFCCAHTTVSEDLAKEMGLEMLQKEVLYGGSGSTECWNATVDSMCVGDIVFRSPMLHVTAVLDSSYERTCVLGNDFMKRLGTQIIFPADHKIVFPRPGKSFGRRSNIIKGNGLYLTKVTVANIEDLFTLDTGAPTTVFLAPFYQRHKALLDQNGQTDTLQLKEATKINSQSYKVIPSMPVTIGKTNVVINYPLVFPELHFNAFGDQNGLLGTSFIECFRKVTIDFDRMYVGFN